MTLEEKLQNLPDDPGVYIMKDAAGHIIYIGKAVSLAERVSRLQALIRQEGLDEQGGRTGKERFSEIRNKLK